MTALRTVDYALVNTDTNEVLRTSPLGYVLESIAGSMRSQARQLGRKDVSNYIVMEMRRSVMGNVLYDQALEVRWREGQRARRA